MSQKTPLYEDHVKLGAHLVEFAKTLLPVRYMSEREEHLAVRNTIGLFDVSHMGEITVTGSSARSFLQQILTNDLDKLADGQAQYSLMLNDRGGVIDDVIVYRMGEHDYFICVNAANVDTDFVHIKTCGTAIADLNITNASDSYAQLALQGPRASILLESLCKQAQPERFSIKKVLIDGIDALLARTGYTGEDGFEIFVAPADATTLWNLLLTRGAHLGIRACGLAARDSLRLEAGMLLCGQDMDTNTSPLEAGLMFAVALHKPNFMGKQALLEQKQRGEHKKLLGFMMEERGSIPRHGYKLFDGMHREIGVVTSGSLVPNAVSAIGFAYVVHERARLNEEVFIDIRGQMKRARLCRPRFLAK